MSSLTGAFFMRVETCTFALSLVLLFSTFGAVFTEFAHMVSDDTVYVHIVHYLLLRFCRIGNLDTPL